MFLKQIQKERNLKNIDFPMCFTVYSARSPFARKAKIEKMGSADSFKKTMQAHKQKVLECSLNLKICQLQNLEE